ncbi:MAG TPA: thioester reductase domain-containing protein [Ktedonobacteraceae bacterium]|nr:thioester reductase domain-containing protein [Ktedonobacteraceae bacterium]
MEHSDLSVDLEGVAIIGIACRFPGAADIEAFWHLLRAGNEGLTFFTEEELITAGVDPEALAQPGYVRTGSVLKDIDLFDAGFFGYTPREAEVIDPQQRLFLECAWHALENAGYNPEACQGAVGIYTGSSDNEYILHVHAHPELARTLGDNFIAFSNSGDYISTRVSYKLNLQGPSINIRSSCSSSLVAVYMACQNLLSYQCDMMLAGGITVSPTPSVGYPYQEGGLLSPDGHCRAFDAEAQGTIFGDGFGIVVLKRLEDALQDGDTIYAVIKGGAINNDGSAKVGFTAPGIDGQAAAIMEAQALAQVDPATVSYIEAHGTGTPLGDPIEITALTRAFRAGTDKNGYCAVGSVKTNIGHLNHAAGIAGLIKTTLMLQHKTLVPSLHFQHPNPQIDFTHSPFYINTQLKPWETQGFPRRAGVSSFGIGGTNAHVLLEEAPEEVPSSPARPCHLLLLSARTPSLLEEMTANLAEHIGAHPEQNLADIAYTLQVGRKQFTYQLACVCHDRADALAVLQGHDPSRLLTYANKDLNRPVVFLFSGQGSQYMGMAADLYQHEPVFRREIDRCADLLSPILGEDLRVLLFSQDEQHAERLRQTQFAQPTLFMLEYALAQLWIAWGIHPESMLGHSVGEYVAACLAGVFTLEDGLKLIALRGRIMQKAAAGSMLAVALPASEVQSLLTEGLSLAAINSPGQCVVAGPTAQIDELRAFLNTQNHKSHRLETSHAFHSSMMDPVLDEFRREVQRFHLQPPMQRYISNVTGTWITAEEATDPAYWARHLRETVQFAAGIQTILAEIEHTGAILLEVGPGQMLKTLAQQQAGSDTPHLFFSSLRRKDDQETDSAFLWQTLGKLWMAGATIEWKKVYANERRKRVPVPGYAFERQRYWLNAPSDPQQLFAAEPAQRTAHKASEVTALQEYYRPALQTAYVAPRTSLEQTICALWKQFFGLESIGVYDDFFALGGHSLLATQLMPGIAEACKVEFPVQKLFELPTIAALAQAIEQLRQDDQHEAMPAVSVVDLRAEVALDADITPESAEPYVMTKEPAAILLTGVTGFIGAFLLHDLLQETQATIYCLVRASSSREARKRIQFHLESSYVWREPYSSRIVAVVGDLAQPLLGLSPEVFDQLAQTIDVIYHNGAWVNFFYPYQTLKATNVLGTKEVLRLACQARVKPLHYISSLAVFELDKYEEEVIFEETTPRYNPAFLETSTSYSQSKWVAEQMVLQCRERGLPVTVYRLGTIAGHSKTGVSNLNDLLQRLLMGCIRFNKVPLINEYFDITPVDYVSKAILHLSRQETASGQIFHLVNPVLVSWQEIITWLLSFGYPLQLLPFSAWRAEIAREAELSADTDVQLLLQLLGADAYPDEHAVIQSILPERRSQYSNGRVLEKLKGTFIVCPSVDAELLGIYLTYLVKKGWVKDPDSSVVKIPDLV